ncbi:isochorismatase family cysteine hydrolase [Pseudonocardia sp. NPDC046786]|uniref:cysteine hydrolase family protein n=1 Tax=Pseudonocardia sp. NPDC046786 TaxID=3155471 RepID=UPI0033F603AC
MTTTGLQALATDRSRAALLLVDYQVGLCTPGPDCLAPPLAAEVARRGTLATSAKVLAAAREAGLLTVFVRLAFDEGYVLRTNRTARFDRYPNDQLLKVTDPGAQIVPELAPEGELVMTKSCVDPFVGTTLLAALHASHIDTVVVGGVATTLAVESTIRHAADSGLQPVVVEDMCASFSPELHDFAFGNVLSLFAEITTSHEVIGALAAG